MNSHFRINNLLFNIMFDLVTLIMALEEEFKGPISDDEATGLATVGDVVNFIEKKAGLTAS